jgi:hypothetical protein
MSSKQHAHAGEVEMVQHLGSSLAELTTMETPASSDQELFRA